MAMAEKHNGHLVPNPESGVEFADGNLAPAPPADDGVFLTELCSRYELTEQEASEIYAEIQEHVEAIRGTINLHAPKTAEYLFQRALRICASARSQQHQAFLLQCLMLSLGMKEDLGVDTAVQLAKRHKLCKADATRYICMFRDILPAGLGRLPALDDQRTPEARAKFAAKRREQEMRRRITT